MGEPGGKTTWGGERKERDEADGGNKLSERGLGEVVSPGSPRPSHSDTKSEASLPPPPDAHTQSPLRPALRGIGRPAALALT